MNDELDALLRRADAGAPADFSARVMRRVEVLPLPARRALWQATWQATWRTTWRTRWPELALHLGQRLALITAAALGIGQVLAFIFGLWAVTAAAAA